MQLPALNTNIDYSNSLFKLVQSQQMARDAQNAAQTRDEQTRQLAEVRQSQNALTQHQINREKQGFEKDQMDMVLGTFKTLNPYDDGEYSRFYGVAKAKLGDGSLLTLPSPEELSTPALRKAYYVGIINAISAKKSGEKYKDYWLEVDGQRIPYHAPEGSAVSIEELTKKFNAKRVRFVDGPEEKEVKGEKPQLIEIYNPETKEIKTIIRGDHIPTGWSTKDFPPKSESKEYDEPAERSLIETHKGKPEAAGYVDRYNKKSKSGLYLEIETKPENFFSKATRELQYFELPPNVLKKDIEAESKRTNKKFDETAKSFFDLENEKLPVLTLPDGTQEQITASGVVEYARKHNISWSKALNTIKEYSKRKGGATRAY